MSARRTKTTVRVVRVYCSDCPLFVRDTEGISFNIQTGEFFMGTCPKGHGDGKPGKVFADKPRECKDYPRR